MNKYIERRLPRLTDNYRFRFEIHDSKIWVILEEKSENTGKFWALNSDWGSQSFNWTNMSYADICGNISRVAGIIADNLNNHNRLMKDLYEA